MLVQMCHVTGNDIAACVVIRPCALDTFTQSTVFASRESSLTRPEGWTIKPSERWSKQMNNKGLVYYLDLETGVSHWFPPCQRCYKARRSTVFRVIIMALVELIILPLVVFKFHCT